MTSMVTLQICIAIVNVLETQTDFDSDFFILSSNPRIISECLYIRHFFISLPPCVQSESLGSEIYKDILSGFETLFQTVDRN